jgi:hypothetical protein
VINFSDISPDGGIPASKRPCCRRFGSIALVNDLNSEMARHCAYAMTGSA